MTLCRILPSFPGGKRKAFTLSYDDGCLTDARLIEMMEKNGIKGTFNLNAGRLNGKLPVASPERADTALAKVRYASPLVEVATHGETHPVVGNIPASLTALDTIHDRLFLEKLFDRRIAGYAYPYGSANRDVAETLRHCGIEWARTVQAVKDFLLPADFLLWDPTCHHSEPALFDLADRFIESAPAEWCDPWLFYVWGHTYEFDQNNDWDRMEAFLDKMGGKEDVWYATNGEIADYMAAYRRLQVSADGSIFHNPTAIDLDIQLHVVTASLPLRKLHIPSGGTVLLSDAEPVPSDK